jgi:hypothetical protein
MNDVMLNGRPATDSEVAALEDAAKCAREREQALLAGVLATASWRPVPEHVPRPVTDITGPLP